MEEEIIACIEFDDIKYLQSGQISKYIFPKKRKEAHLKKIPHLITRFFIISENQEGKRQFLVQKRGNMKNEFPEYFTDSSSGHILYSEKLTLDKIKKDAIRELEEEFGIHSRDIKKILFHDLWIEEEEVAYVFFGMVDYDIELTPNPKELDIKESKFYSKLELEYILENKKNIEITKRTWKTLMKIDIDTLFVDKIKQIGHNNKNIALFIGRFQPLHHGHIYVIKNILKSHKKVKIGIGSSQLSHTINDPFTSQERIEFLKAALEKRKIPSKRYEIYEIPDIFNAKKWVDHVVSIVGEFDTIFSNSNWVRELFLKKKIKVGKKINIFKKKYNGSNIRDQILKNNKKYRTLIPNEVIELIEKYNGIDRIKTLKKKS